MWHDVNQPYVCSHPLPILVIPIPLPTPCTLLTSRPPGSQEDYETAKYTAQKFREFGLQNVRIEPVEVLLNHPVEDERYRHHVSVRAKVRVKVKVKVLCEDQD